jgi:hypothetical protein
MTWLNGFVLFPPSPTHSLNCIALCCVMLTVLCCVVLCCAVLCCVVLCCLCSSTRLIKCEGCILPRASVQSCSRDTLQCVVWRAVACRRAYQMRWEERRVCVFVWQEMYVLILWVFFCWFQGCCVHVLYLFLFAVCDMCCCHPCFLCCCNSWSFKNRKWIFASQCWISISCSN